jgi:uncharacterized protein (TIGR02246 family)
MAGSPDEESILREIDAFAAAWSRGDASETASFFTPDGVRVGAAGDVQRGRAELESAFEQLLHGRFAGATVTLERGAVRMLTPELALWRGEMTITPGGAAPPIKGHVVQLMKRVDGRWLVLESHPKLYPAPR